MIDLGKNEGGNIGRVADECWSKPVEGSWGGRREDCGGAMRDTGTKTKSVSTNVSTDGKCKGEHTKLEEG